MKKIISLLMVFAMITALAACGNTKNQPTSQQSSETKTEQSQEKTSESSVEEPVEPVKITVFPLNANTMSGEIGGWLGEYLLEHGLIVEILAHSADKLQAMIASEDLPDIVYLPSSVDHKALAESGMLLDLEEHLDKLPHVVENEQYAVAVNYTKEFVTGGPLVMLPQNVGPSGYATSTTAFGLNWEVYEQIGAPEFSTLEELIPVLKKMQEACPESEAGDKMYAMNAFGGFDNSYFYNMLSIFGVMGYSTSELKYGIELNNVDQSFDWILEDDSAYKYGLWYMNQLYKEGLMDPDSISTERGVQHKKQESGAALAGWGGVPVYEKDGYYPVYFDEFKVAVAKRGFPYGNSTYAAISAKTENLEAALKFLDMSADPEHVRAFMSGPQGGLWDYNDAGEVVLTAEGEKAYLKGEEAKIGEHQYVYFNAPWLLHPNTIHADGEMVSVASGRMVVDLKNQSDGQKKWAEHYGYPNIRVMLADKGNEIATFSESADKFAAAPNDDQTLIVSAAKYIICNASWKMVYAETDAEFEEIWDKLEKDIDELGFKKIYDWRVSELQKGLEIRDSLEK